MACAYAKFTGRLGVCLATSGPGGIHLLNGLYDAKMDQQPVLAITGMQFNDVTGTFSQQDVELDKLFMDVACYNERVMSAPHMEPVADLAIRSAIDEARRGAHHDSDRRAAAGRGEAGPVGAQRAAPHLDASARSAGTCRRGTS